MYTQVEDSGLRKRCFIRSNSAISIRENDRKKHGSGRQYSGPEGHRTGNGVFQTFPPTGKKLHRQRILLEKTRNPQELSVRQTGSFRNHTGITSWRAEKHKEKTQFSVSTFKRLFHNNKFHKLKKTTWRMSQYIIIMNHKNTLKSGQMLKNVFLIVKSHIETSHRSDLININHTSDGR